MNIVTMNRHTREDITRWMEKKQSPEYKMHVIYNRLRLILLAVDGWRHVIFTFSCMQTHQTQEHKRPFAIQNTVPCVLILCSLFLFIAVEPQLNWKTTKKKPTANILLAKESWGKVHTTHVAIAILKSSAKVVTDNSMHHSSLPEYLKRLKKSAVYLCIKMCN